MDLRLHDQPALDAAAKRANALGGPLAFCFLQSREEDGDTLHGGEGHTSALEQDRVNSEILSVALGRALARQSSWPKYHVASIVI